MAASLEVFSPKLDNENSSRGTKNIRVLLRELKSNIRDRKICLGNSDLNRELFKNRKARSKS